MIVDDEEYFESLDPALHRNPFLDGVSRREAERCYADVGLAQRATALFTHRDRHNVRIPLHEEVERFTPHA